YAASGICTLSGNTVHVTNVGNCTIVASQEGLDQYDIANTAPKPWYPADDVSHVFHVNYPYSGFFAPISNTDTNGVQAGSAVPIKFNLGVDQGMGILAAGSPRSREVSCATGATLGSPAAATPPGNSGLQYDALLNQYTYVWKTDKAWAGTCRTLEVSLADGSV